MNLPTHPIGDREKAATTGRSRRDRRRRSEPSSSPDGPTLPA
jgi:hypothetical protein